MSACCSVNMVRLGPYSSPSPGLLTGNVSVGDETQPFEATQMAAALVDAETPQKGEAQADAYFKLLRAKTWIMGETPPESEVAADEETRENLVDSAKKPARSPTLDMIANEGNQAGSYMSLTFST